METPMNITDLPVEILGKIFDELDENDQFNFARLNPNLGRALTHFTKNKCTKIKLWHRKVSEWAQFLPMYGASILEIVEIREIDPLLLDLIKEHCPNIQRVKLRINENNCSAINSLLASLTKLRSVCLWNGCAA